MTDGKKGRAPCGHVGVHVTTNYVQCPLCDVTESDGIPIDLFEDDVTLPLCKHCGSDDVEEWPDLWIGGHKLTYCNTCNKSGGKP